MHRPFAAFDLLAAAAVVLIWGLNFIPMKIGLRELTPLQLGAARFLFGALPLILFVRPPSIGLRWLFFYALVQGVAQSTFLFFALQVGMTAALASVLMQTQVFVTAILGVLFLGETSGRPLKVGILLAGAGLACFAVNALQAGGTAEVTVLGLLLNVGAASMWASSNIIVKKVQAGGAVFNPVSLLAWSCAVSALVFLAMSFAVEPQDQWSNWLNASASTWMAAAYLGWAANIGAYWLWTTLLHRHAASRIAPLSLGMPVVGLLAGMLILGEAVNEWQWAGAALVISALGSVVAGTTLTVRRRGLTGQ